MGLLWLTFLNLPGHPQAPGSGRLTGIPPQREPFARVERAKQDCDHRLRQKFLSRHLDYPPDRIYLRVFKQERIIELWAETGAGTFRQVTAYPFCSFSGTLGPKRRQGDLQIPEGFYFINRFNPFSRFFLSLGIDYPNRSDRIRGDRRNPGGDIFIHGSCVTIGCIPITDDKIKELYWVAEQARRQGQERIPVHIFPAKLEENNLKALLRLAGQPTFWRDFKLLIGDHHPHSTDELSRFWENLKTVYDHFEKNHRIPEILINHRGVYMIRDIPASE